MKKLKVYQTKGRIFYNA